MKLGEIITEVKRLKIYLVVVGNRLLAQDQLVVEELCLKKKSSIKKIESISDYY